MISQILGAIIALKDIFKMISKAFKVYNKSRRKATRALLRKKVDKAIEERRTDDFETELGNDNAGKPTKHNIPGLRRRKRRNPS